MAPNRLVQEGSWFMSPGTEGALEPWVEKGKGGTEDPGASSCSQATSTTEAPNFLDLKQATCLAYPARLQGR